MEAPVLTGAGATLRGAADTTTGFGGASWLAVAKRLLCRTAGGFVALVSMVFRKASWIFPCVLAIVSLAGVLGAHEHGNDGNGLGLAVAVLLDFLSGGEDSNVFEDGSRNVK